jgi:exodeoxyribonuclease V gamma subunit
MDELFARYQSTLARWPLIVEGEEEIRFSAVVEGQTLEVADWLGGIRTTEDGQRGRVILETSNVVKDNLYRSDKLIRHWLTHLASHLAGGPLTTTIVSKLGQVELKPVDVGEAETYLKTVLSAWQQGMRRPLPLAAKTAFAWLKAMPMPDKDEGEAGAPSVEARKIDINPEPPVSELNPEKAREAARKVYEGGFKQTGELGTCDYLQRSYPDFSTLYAGGEFAKLAETLLRPLHLAIPVERKKTDKSMAQTETGAAA